MRRSDIVDVIAEELDLTAVKAEEAVVAVLEAIKAALVRGEPVILRGFGSFEVRAKQAREGRNPRTGESAEIAARRVVRFKAGNRLKAGVNGEATRAPL